MIKIMLVLYGLLLGITSWFIAKKAARSFSFFVNKQKEPALIHFTKRNAWFYLGYSLLAFLGAYLDTESFTASILVITSLHSAIMAWRLAAFIKK